jgi:two-component system, LytTR family, sensor kinase
MDLKKIRVLNFWQYQIIGWILVKFTIDSQQIVGSMIAGKNPTGESLLLSFLVDLVAFALTVGMRYIYRYIYKKEFFVFRTIVLIAVISYLASVVTYLTVFPFQDMMGMKYGPVRLGTVLTNLMWNFPIFFVWSLLYFGIKFWKDMLAEKEKAQNAIMLAQKSKLQMLRYQLNPHFLFNSLNSIQTLVHENPDQAESMVTELSDFLRSTLEFNDRLMIPVSEEMEITRKYLAIEKVRYEERLTYILDADENILNLEIPCFITQPLVENSIRHGLHNSPLGINIILKFSVIEGQLIINVANTGHLSDNWKIGIGIKNIIDRLENIYPDNFRFTLSEANGFVIARIIINFRNEKVNSTDN